MYKRFNFRKIINFEVQVTQYNFYFTLTYMVKHVNSTNK